MKFISPLIVFFFVYIFITKNATSEKVPTNDEISSLHFKDLDDFINDENRYVFLIVYAPWCQRSITLLENLNKISLLLKYDKNVKIGKMNVATNIEIVNKLNIFLYPSLFLIHNNEIFTFTDSLSIRNIISWIYKHAKNENAYELTNVEKLISYVEHDEYNNPIVFFISKNNNDDELLKSLISTCVEVNSSFCFYIKEKLIVDYLEKTIMPKNHFEMSDKLKKKNRYTVLFKNNEFDESFIMQNETLDVIYDTSISDSKRVAVLREFILRNAEPTIIKFSENYYELLFSPDVITLFIIYKDINSLNKAEIANAAKKFENKVIFSISGSEKVFEKRLLNELIIEEVEKPLMRIILFKRHVNIPYKYKPKDDDIEINEKSIVEFVEGFFSGNDYFYRKSEKALPEEINNGYVKIIVADTYDDLIFKNDKNVVVLYYAPWCGHCRKFEPVYRELGKRLSIYSAKFKDYNNDIIISKIDAVNNEVYNISISGYPSIYLYEKSDKTNPIKYTGLRDVHNIITWVSQKTTTNLDVTELLSLSLDDEQLFENYEEL